MIPGKIGNLHSLEALGIDQNNLVHLPRDILNLTSVHDNWLDSPVLSRSTDLHFDTTVASVLVDGQWQFPRLLF